MADLIGFVLWWYVGVSAALVVAGVPGWLAWLWPVVVGLALGTCWWVAR
jgi:hypothetical protein